MSGPDAAPIPRHIAHQAAHWLMRLGAQDVTEDDRQACLAWRAQDPQHEQAWQRAQRIPARLAQIPTQIGVEVLGRTGTSRRKIVKAVALLIAAGPGAWAVSRSSPWREWHADFRTATGQRRQVVLSDGSLLDLNTASAADQRFDARQRLLTLHAGEILVSTVPDARQPPRDFTVTTPHGMLRALGTRFVARTDDDGSRVTVLSGAVELHVAGTATPWVVETGRQACFSSHGILSSGAADPHAADWAGGLLRADGMPLGAFLAELSRYRTGWLRCDPALAHLPVSGFYQLSDPDAVLRALTETLPVQVTWRTPYWVMVERAEG